MGGCLVPSATLSQAERSCIQMGSDHICCSVTVEGNATRMVWDILDVVIQLYAVVKLGVS